MKGARKRRKGWFVKGHKPIKKQMDMDNVTKTEVNDSSETKSSNGANGDTVKLKKTKKVKIEKSGLSEPDNDGVYEYSFNLDLEDLISSTLDDLCGPKSEESVKFQSDLSKIAQQFKSIERKQRDLTRTYTECSEKLRKYREELEEADREEELKEAAAEIDAREAAEANAKVDDDSDDDVQFVAATYDPKIAEKRQMNQLPKTVISNPTPNTIKTEPLTIQPGAVLVKLPPNAVAGSPNLQNSRQALAALLNRQIPSGTPVTGAAKPTLQAYNNQRNQQMIEKQYREDVDKIDIGSKVLAKKFNDIWYKGTVADIQNKNLSTDERKYGIKFDGKGKKVLSAKHVAFKESLQRQIYVGTRAVAHMFQDGDALYKEDDSTASFYAALYKEDDSTASFYAGIIAETPNGRNQHRYLIFFDDGYAQYSSSSDIHKVFLQSENVWEDIHPDSQEFIKEYLKQYPERPMVRLHKGQMVKTEWNGKWWDARVMEVDASLVKMYFLADRREELIYRGSTRLEPLYTALANAEINKTSGKMKRRNMDTKGNKPIVEYTRGLSEEYKTQTAAQNPSQLQEQSVKYQAQLADQKTKQVVDAMEFYYEKQRGQTPLSVRSVAAMFGIPQSTLNARLLKARDKALDSDLYGNEPSEMVPEMSGKALGSVQGQETKKRAVARKSTGGGGEKPLSTDSATWEAPWLKQQSKKDINGGYIKQSKEFVASSISSQKVGQDMASVLQERLAKTVSTTGDIEEEALGERKESKLLFRDRVRKKFVPHICGKNCLKDTDDDGAKYKGTNPLLIPLLCGWERHVCKMKPSNRRVVMYRTPCARRLRDLDDLDCYLFLTKSNLTIDMFCFDPVLHVHTEFVPVKTFCDIKDLSYGKENVPISCVNGIDRQYPDYVEYSNVRIPAKGVKLNLDPNFLTCCSCTDGCRDKSKCECQQLTIEASGVVEGGKTNKNAGFEHRRLKEPLTTGVYECNSMCKCDHRCYNKVVQNGLQVRLQVFKTEKKGWGLRCLDDLPAGGFICIYAGQLLTEQGANEDGQQYGDEYLAELDYIEVVEKQKEGYESDVDMDEGLGQDSDDDDDSGEDRNAFSDSDSDFSGGDAGASINASNPHRTRTRSRADVDHGNDDDEKKLGKLVLRRDSSRSDNKEDGWYTSQDSGKQTQQKSVKLQGPSPEKKAASTAAWVSGTNTLEPITIDDEEDMDLGADNSKDKMIDSFGMDSDSLPDLDAENVKEDEVIKQKKEKKREDKKIPQIAKKVESTENKNINEPKVYPEPQRTCLTARRSTSKMSRFKNLPDPKKKLPMTEEEGEEEEDDDEDKMVGTRSYFQDGQACYIMDAKSMGNIGRYLNHSCSPNVFVQNVFVDTHDLRFPWVTFFAGQYIRAGTELTWDYNYEVGSVPGKILHCYCGSAECRGRLL